MLFNREMSNTEMLKKMVVMESKALEYGKIRRNDLSEKNRDEFESISDKIKTQYENLIMYDGVRSLDDSLREIANVYTDKTRNSKNRNFHRSYRLFREFPFILSVITPL